jgi:hypothetical protein
MPWRVLGGMVLAAALFLALVGSIANSCRITNLRNTLYYETRGRNCQCIQEGEGTQ